MSDSGNISRIIKPLIVGEKDNGGGRGRELPYLTMLCSADLVRCVHIFLSGLFCYSLVLQLSLEVLSLRLFGLHRNSHLP